MQVDGNAVSLMEYYAELARKRTGTASATGAGQGSQGSGGVEGASSEFAALFSKVRQPAETEGASSGQDVAGMSGKDLLAQLEGSSRLSGVFGTAEDEERGKDMLASLAKMLLQPDGAMSAGAAGLMTGMIKGAYGA